MSVRGILESLLRIVGDSEDYLVSGSLSFLPLLGEYREPGHDVDATLEKSLFERRRPVIEREGRPHVLRLPEVAVANASPLTRILAPRTDFIHLETPEGLLDLTLYRREGASLLFALGAGLSLQVPAMILERVRTLVWRGLSYRAGLPELSLLPKLVWYQQYRAAPRPEDPEARKHLLDLQRLPAIVDWDLCRFLLASFRIRWLGRELPTAIDRRFDPFRSLDLDRLREELASMAAATGDRG